MQRPRLRLFPLVLLTCNAAYGQCLPPAIQAGPVSRTVAYGDVLTLSVAAIGTAPLSYQWYSFPNSAPTSGAPTKVGVDSPQYTTPPVTANIVVYVVVSNACGSMTSSMVGVILEVNLSPPFAYQAANSASSYPSGPGGFGIAQGSLFVVYGSSMGPDVLQQASVFPIPLNLGGTSIQINMAGTNYSAPMIYTSASQLAAILPSAVPVGNGTLTVTYNGTPAYPIPIHVVQSAFGIFTVTSDGAGAGVIQDVNNRLLTFAQPAHAGDTVVLWGTGLGPVNGVDAAGPLPGNLFKPQVFVGNQPAAVQYAGRSGCCAALDQIVFQIPPNVQGCFVPVAVRSNGVVSNFASVPIGAAGIACSDPVGFSPELLSKAATGAAIGAIALGPIPVLQTAGFSFEEGLAERLSSLLGTKISEGDVKTIIRASGSRRGRAWKAAMKKYAPLLRARNIDPATIVAMVTALNYQGVKVSFQQFQGPSNFWAQFASVIPPAGTCIAGIPWSYQGPGPVNNPTSQAADAGPQLLLTGPGGTQTLNRLSNGQYDLSLAPGSTNFGLPSGTYSVSANGGKNIGAFTATIDVGSKLTWTNKASVNFIDRSQALTVNWSGGAASGYVVFGGTTGYDQSGGTNAAFLCVEDVRKQTMTVPDFVLGAMPHTSNGSVFLTAHPLQNLFSAPGIDFGFFADLSSDSKTLGYQ